MILQGKNLIVISGGSVIASAKSCTVNIDCETIKVSSPTDGQWEHVIAGMKSWSVSTTHFVSVEHATDMVLMGYLLRVGSESNLRIQLTTSEGNITMVQALEGTAVCKSCQITATKGNLMQGSFKFQGTGALSFT
jgi:predicted secreted protein